MLLVVVVYCLAQCIGHMAIDCYKPTDSGCQPLAILFIACAACNVATDLAILFLPIWILRPMKVPTGRKVGIALILMAGGLLVSSSSVFHLPHADIFSVYLPSVLSVWYQLYTSRLRILPTNGEIALNGGKVYGLLTLLASANLRSLIECWSGLICACLPCIKPFFTRYFPSFPLWSLLQDSSGSMRQLRTID